MDLSKSVPTKAARKAIVARNSLSEIVAYIEQYGDVYQKFTPEQQKAWAEKDEVMQLGLNVCNRLKAVFGGAE